MLIPRLIVVACLVLLILAGPAQAQGWFSRGDCRSGQCSQVLFPPRSLPRAPAAIPSRSVYPPGVHRANLAGVAPYQPHRKGWLVRLFHGRRR